MGFVYIHTIHCIWYKVLPTRLSYKIDQAGVRLMSLTIFHCCWLSLTVSPSSIELMHVDHCLQWLLAFSHYIYMYSPMELLHVSHVSDSCWLSLKVSPAS